MKRVQMLVACAILTGASLAVLAGAPMAAQAATVEMRESARGQILVDEAGYTLYMFTADKKHVDHCVDIAGAYGSCVAIWPPLELAEGETPTAGMGIKSKFLGTTTLPGGEKQVTFKKRPLYTYSGDTHPAETSYVGFKEFGGSWFALSWKGRVVK